MKRALSLLLLLAISPLLFAAGGDWPHWRGPNRDAISTETGLLKQWPEGGPTLLWKAEKLGKGYASVAVVGGTIFTAGDVGPLSFVQAIDAQGKLLWSANLGRSGDRGGFSGPRATPTIDGGQIYMLGQFGDIVCLERAGGKEVWRKNLVKDFQGRVGDWGWCESLIVDGNNLICTPGGTNGTLMALNKKSGEMVWRTADWKDSADYVSATVATIAGVKQYVQLTPRSVAGVSTDGKLLWRAERKGSTAIIPTPVVKDDLVYVTSGYGVGCNLFKITKTDGTFKAEQTYANKTMVNHHGGVILLGENLYGYSDGKGWVCQKFATGEMVWSDKSLGKGSLVCADGRLYLRKEEGRGTVALIEATPEGYKEMGHFDQPNRSDKNSWPHPVVAGGRLYLRDQDVLLCYEVKAP